MDEATLGREVRRLAQRYGIRAVHIPDSRTAIGAAGLPDWILVGRQVLWRELKSSWGQLETDQVWWKYALQAAGQDHAIWRPLDLETGRIAQELQAIAPDWAMPV